MPDPKERTVRSETAPSDVEIVGEALAFILPRHPGKMLDEASVAVARIVAHAEALEAERDAAVTLNTELRKLSATDAYRNEALEAALRRIEAWAHKTKEPRHYHPNCVGCVADAALQPRDSVSGLTGPGEPTMRYPDSGSLVTGPGEPEREWWKQPCHNCGSPGGPPNHVYGERTCCPDCDHHTELSEHTAQPTPSHVCGYGRCNTYRPPGGKNPYEAQPTPSPQPSVTTADVTCPDCGWPATRNPFGDTNRCPNKTFHAATAPSEGSDPALD